MEAWENRAAGCKASRAEAERGRRGAGRGRAWGGKGGPGEGGTRTRRRPAGSREVDKAAAAFDVSGELILNRYKMAEGDEAARRQQSHEGLRRRRRTSDPNTGVNHVSSTTLLGTGRRGVGCRARVGRGRGPLGLAGTGRRLWGRRPPLGRLSSSRRVWPPRLAPAAPPSSRGARPERAVLRPRLPQLSGARAARASAPGPAPCLPARRVVVAASSPPEGAAWSRGRRPGARGGWRRRGEVLGSSGRPVTRPALAVLCPSRGKGGRVNQVVMGPAEEEDAQLAGGGDTSLPGWKVLQTPFQEGTAVRRPGLCPGARIPGTLGCRTHSCG